jgi:hypothetical protein
MVVAMKKTRRRKAISAIEDVGILLSVDTVFSNFIVLPDPAWFPDRPGAVGVSRRLVVTSRRRRSRRR